MSHQNYGFQTRLGLRLCFALVVLNIDQRIAKAFCKLDDSHQIDGLCQSNGRKPYKDR